MTKPLAMVCYEKLLPGSQLVHRLEDMKYRVQPVSDPTMLVDEAERGKPLLVMVDVEPRHPAVCNVIRDLRRNKETGHVPIIAIAADANDAAQTCAREAGATLVVSDQAILQHLEQFLDQALEV